MNFWKIKKEKEVENEHFRQKYGLYDLRMNLGITLLKITGNFNEWNMLHGRSGLTNMSEVD
jgi:hypothetical protein